MSRTYRNRYTGETIRDGDWGKRCPDPQCNICGTGAYKGLNNRAERRKQQNAIKEQRE